MEAQPPQPTMHPIGVVVARTGLSAEVLRAWERRYEAVVPQRSEGGRRLYSDEDLERLRLLARATSQGRSIGQVAHLGELQLRRLIAADAAASEGTYGAAANALAAMGNCEAPSPLEIVRDIEDAGSRLSARELAEEVLVPLLEGLDALPPGDPRQEATLAMIRAFLAGYRSALRGRVPLGRIAVATPTGQGHVVGMLLAGAVAQGEGWEAEVLGDRLSAGEIAARTIEAGAHAVGLSLCWPTDDTRIPRLLNELKGLLPAGFPILLGGRAAAAYRVEGTEVIASWGQFREILERVAPPTPLPRRRAIAEG